MTLATATAGALGRRRELTTIGTVGAAHFASHFLQLSLAPLLPLMRDDFNVGFTELGFLVTVFFATSGIGQVVAGILVDRFGAHRLLIGGLILQAGSVLAMGFAPGYLALLPLAVTAGLGNTVYHPADLSILSRRINAGWIGRAFAAHALAGSLGYAVAPVLVGAMAMMWGWRPALMGAGAIGLGIAAVLLLCRSSLATDGLAKQARPGAAGRDAAASDAAGAGGPTSFAAILALPVVIYGFAFFLLTSTGGGGFMNFSVSALIEGYGVTLAVATIAATMHQVGVMSGVLIGGVVADRVTRHSLLAMGAIGSGALVALVVALSPLGPFGVVALLALAGLGYGVSLPSRDVLIRRIAPQSGLGKVFGTVYAGLDAGQLLGPLMFGPLLDHHQPRLIFIVSAVAWALATLSILALRMRAGAR